MPGPMHGSHMSSAKCGEETKARRSERDERVFPAFASQRAGVDRFQKTFDHFIEQALARGDVAVQGHGAYAKLVAQRAHRTPLGAFVGNKVERALHDFVFSERSFFALLLCVRHGFPFSVRHMINGFLYDV